MKTRSLIVWLTILILLLPVFFIIKILRKKLDPRRSFQRLLLYILLAFGLVFGYTFFVVWMISHLFPVSIK